MSQITVFYTDGSKEVFEETSRPGGSYHTTYKVGNGFLLITDAYGNTTGIPESTIKTFIAR